MVKLAELSNSPPNNQILKIMSCVHFFLAWEIPLGLTQQGCYQNNEVLWNKCACECTSELLARVRELERKSVEEGYVWGDERGEWPTRNDLILRQMCWPMNQFAIAKPHSKQSLEIKFSSSSIRSSIFGHWSHSSLYWSSTKVPWYQNFPEKS